MCDTINNKIEFYLEWIYFEQKEQKAVKGTVKKLGNGAWIWFGAFWVNGAFGGIWNYSNLFSNKNTLNEQ